MDTKNLVICLFEGYAIIQPENPNVMFANCTCTLIKCKTGKYILIDTMTPWDRDKLVQALASHNVLPEDVSFVVNTHGHSDHIGNNNCFLKAKHIVGQSISFKNQYELHDFKDPYVIEESIKVIATKGHTIGCVSVIVNDGACNGIEGVIGIVGDLFECCADIDDDRIWKEAGSEDENSQTRNRSLVADIADYILPGHGSGFTVTEDMRLKLRAKLLDN